MLTHRTRAKTAAIAAVLATVIALLAVIAYQGAAAAQGQPPPAPQNPMAHLIAGGGQDPQVRVSWDAPAQGTAASHTVSRNDSQNFEVPGGATTYSDRAISPGTAYSYTVTAGNASGSSPASAPATAQVPPAPSAPGSLAGSAAEPQAADETATVTLTWTASTVPEAASCETAYPLRGYTIVRSNGEQETELGTADADATSFTDSTAAFSTDYTYRVMAQSAIGASPASETLVEVFPQPVLPPTGLTASIADPFDGSISLSWTAPSEGADIIEYSVHRYLGPDPYEGTDTPVTLFVQAPETSAADDTAEAGVTHSYLVIAHSAFSISLPSNAAVIEAPAPVSGLTATAGDGRVDLAWNAPAAGTPGGYRVERQPLNGEWTNIADTTAASHSDNTAQPNAAYRYRVQHRNGHGGSAWTLSNPVDVIAKPDTPGGLSAAQDGTDNVLSWTEAAADAIDGYRLRHSVGGGEWKNIMDRTGRGSVEYRHGNAAADVEHRYAVQSYNAAGSSEWSEPVSTMRVTPPDTPANLAAVVEGGDFLVSWDRPGAVHLDGYQVRTRTGEESTGATEDMASGATSHRIVDPIPNTLYRISVRARNAGGMSEWSGEIEIILALMPGTPRNVAARVENDDIVVSWDPNPGDLVDLYRVKHQVRGSTEWTEQDAPSGQTSFRHTDNLEGVTYLYSVLARNSAGSSPWSTPPVEATRLSAPGVPGGLSAEPRGQAVLVSWEAPPGTVDRYQVRHSTGGGEKTEPIDITAPETEFLHEDALGDTTYEYEVRAVNALGNSGWAGPAAGRWTIPPNAPSGLTVEISGDNLLASWSAPQTGGVVAQYEINHRPEAGEWLEAVVMPPATSFEHAGPVPAQRYEYRVRSRNAGGVSDWTPVETGTWVSGAAPPEVSNIIANSSIVGVQYHRHGNPDVDSFQARFRPEGTEEWTPLSRTSGYIFVYRQQDNPDWVEFTIRSMIGDVGGDWRPVQRVDLTTPSQVTNVRAHLEGYDGIRVHWDDPVPAIHAGTG